MVWEASAEGQTNRLQPRQIVQRIILQIVELIPLTFHVITFYKPTSNVYARGRGLTIIGHKHSHLSHPVALVMVRPRPRA